jgi:hypothetical protein
LKEKIVERAVEQINTVISENVYHSKRRGLLVLTTTKDELKEKIADALKLALHGFTVK